MLLLSTIFTQNCMKTRIHSSRMHTVHHSFCLCRGFVCRGGVKPSPILWTEFLTPGFENIIFSTSTVVGGNESVSAQACTDLSFTTNEKLSMVW